MIEALREVTGSLALQILTTARFASRVAAVKP